MQIKRTFEERSRSAALAAKRKLFTRAVEDTWYYVDGNVQDPSTYGNRAFSITKSELLKAKHILACDSTSGGHVRAVVMNNSNIFYFRSINYGGNIGGRLFKLNCLKELTKLESKSVLKKLGYTRTPCTCGSRC